MTFLKKYRLLAIFSLLGLFGAAAWLLLPDQSRKHSAGGAGDIVYVESIRRISSEQYRLIMRDVFGDSVHVTGSFADPIPRNRGLLSIGAAESGISAVGFAVAEKMARKVAAQVVDKDHRRELIGCQPVKETEFDPVCAQQFIESVGRLLYRRPLSEQESAKQLASASSVAQQKNDFYAGLERSLVNMMISPNFLFRVESSEPDPEQPDSYRLTSLSKASRLSFLLWNSAPDALLLDAAQRGELHSQKGLQRQVERMLTSSRLEQGIRGFFTDMLAFDEFELLSKDLSIFPKFTNQALKDSKEQSLLTIVDHVLARNADYRDLFITPKTFLTPTLAALLKVPLIQQLENAAPDRWQPYEFDADDPRAGIVSQPGFVALHAHPGRTSPTLRGKALRENLLCQQVPDPPPDVDFSLVQSSGHGNLKTMRQRLTAHATAPACAGCHKITDPIGLALESFDGSGAYRRRENGVPIDTSGELDGISYEDALGLGKALRSNASVVSCLVNRLYAYGIGREVLPGDRKWLKQVRKTFAGDGYRILELLRTLGTSEEFYLGAGPVVKTMAQR